MNEPIQVFVGNPLQESSEQSFLAQLRHDLERQAVSARICANFVAGRHYRQIDFLIATDKRTIHCELKTFHTPVVGGPNGRWRETLADGTERDLEAQNPYRQAHDGTYGLSDDMRALAKREPAMADPEGLAFYKRIDTVVCVYPVIPPLSKLDPYPYVTVVGYDELLERLATDGPRVPWDDEQWDTFVRERSSSDWTKLRHTRRRNDCSTTTRAASATQSDQDFTPTSRSGDRAARPLQHLLRPPRQTSACSQLSSRVLRVQARHISLHI
jgi:hypothetical protein